MRDNEWLLVQLPGGMPKSFSHSHLPMHYTGPGMMPFQSSLAGQGALGSPRWLVCACFLRALFPSIPLHAICYFFCVPCVDTYT